MRIRGTPFITALIMSAAAMFIIPDAVKPDDPETAAKPGGRAALSSARLTPAAPASSAPASTPPPPVAAQAAPGAAHTLRAGPVTLTVNGFWSWSMYDRRTGELVGSPNLATRSDTASMIKAWIAADYLRRAAEKNQGVDANRLRALSTMIRDSNNEVASSYHRTNGGAPSIARMIQICGLTDSRAVTTGSWSTTEVSARDGVRLGLCIADGRAAGPKWTPWLLSEMRQVRGAGRFGAVAAMGPEVVGGVATKNGWINRRDGKWHIACLAIGAEWILTVLVQYPVSLGFGYGSNVCKQVAVQLGSTA